MADYDIDERIVSVVMEEFKITLSLDTIDLRIIYLFISWIFCLIFMIYCCYSGKMHDKEIRKKKE